MRPWPAYRQIYRSLEHSHAVRVLQSERRSGLSSEALKTVGAVFAGLQEERHAADYDPDYRIGKTDVLILLADAERAIDLLKSIPPAERKLLAARLIGRTRN